ncbi:MAG: VOC family protein [Acidimicrobiia bacterium]|nr:VOC family protein [Acidimicrobiia bacterium]NNC91461.1 VOC family protein [Acidimicrobiia bacterium]
MSDKRQPDVPLLIAATIDCSDLECMTRFWGALLDVQFQIAEPFGFLAHSPARKVTIWLQQVPEEKAGENRVHLDFVVADLDAALARVESLGGEAGDRHQWCDFVGNTCANPEGNVFDLMQGQALEE